MNIVPFPKAALESVAPSAAVILNAFTRLLADIQTQQTRLTEYGLAPELRNAMMLDMANASLRMFDANIKFLNVIKDDLESEPAATDPGVLAAAKVLRDASTGA